ncbi:unnamed protein product [Gadus morhua 'NCC']
MQPDWRPEPHSRITGQRKRLWPLCGPSVAPLWPLCGPSVAPLWPLCGPSVAPLWQWALVTEGRIDSGGAWSLHSPLYRLGLLAKRGQVCRAEGAPAGGPANEAPEPPEPPAPSPRWGARACRDDASLSAAS